ncbi:hypothetical protein GCM10010389_43790 [Streptomyces echinoruber]|uniref:Uncharacterized protein n=1 Tax=Streptomyces echinoruber TaxID=68898 RepID=A0A918RI96_9ACTN|nr:hypothetical protein GCM10010389_43790 [Streptomyces echinoruber]
MRADVRAPPARPIPPPSPKLSASPPLSAPLERGDPHEQGGTPTVPEATKTFADFPATT